MGTELLNGHATSVLDRFRLDGKVVVVTGATSGLGVAFAQACAQAGADVVVTGRRTDRLAETVELIATAGRQGLAVAADVAVEADCQRVVESAVERFGRIDVLVNNAGIEEHVPAEDLSIAEFQRVIDVNVTGGFRMAQACVEAMPPGSTIINISSVMGITTLQLPSAGYSASKAGVLGLTRSLARQWTPGKGIRVNALLPGFFPTEMTSERAAGLLADRLVMGRLGDPTELAAALVFLASDASSYMTGSELVVDGGMLLT